MIDDLAYIVSTCRGYEQPLGRLLASMPRGAQVFVVRGGCAARYGYSERGVLFVEVEHVSYDYTALIELVEGEWDLAEHVFLLHDTMELGPESDRLIRAAYPKPAATAVWGGQCNLALYRTDYLFQRRDALLALKGCTKARAVEAEGFLWKQLLSSHRSVYAGDLQTRGAARPYGGAERLVEYYSGVDLVKYKANWGQHHPARVVIP